MYLEPLADELYRRRGRSGQLAEEAEFCASHEELAGAGGFDPAADLALLRGWLPQWRPSSDWSQPPPAPTGDHVAIDTDRAWTLVGAIHDGARRAGNVSPPPRGARHGPPPILVALGGDDR